MTTTPVWMKVMEVVIIVLFAIECASFHAHRLAAQQPKLLLQCHLD